MSTFFKSIQITWVLAPNYKAEFSNLSLPLNAVENVFLPISEDAKPVFEYEPALGSSIFSHNFSSFFNRNKVKTFQNEGKQQQRCILLNSSLVSPSSQGDPTNFQKRIFLKLRIELRKCSPYYSLMYFLSLERLK